MRHFDELYAIAAARKGEDVLAERLPNVSSESELIGLTDDRYLSHMTQMVFSAGFVWRVIRSKWPGFEEAFMEFDPIKVVTLAEADPERLFTDTRIVRNPQKIKATYDNARFVLDIAHEHGSFGEFVAAWPADDIVGLWEVLKKQGARLGGDSGPRFLRTAGKDTFILTGDVVTSLTQQGILEGKGTSKKAKRAANEAFLTWQQQSGRPMAQISVIIACTIGE
ncbi:MAG: 3-methyladenine DNA glycosylase Tag [Myxococcota bacterium]|jgi:3-methyladenine DNA glycosylase Tag